MAFDRYCALCKPSWRRFRSFYLAITLSMLAWTLSAVAASPVFLNVDIRMNILINNSYGNTTRDECKTNFLQGRAFAGRYVFGTTIVIFFLPLSMIIYFYYHILIKMQQALQTNRRMSRSASSRAPYQRVTYFVLTVIFAHVFAWTPFWVYTLCASLGRIRRSDAVRLLLNVMHLLPYINCAANPFIYLANFRKAFQAALQIACLCQTSRHSSHRKLAKHCSKCELTIAQSRWDNGVTGHVTQSELCGRGTDVQESQVDSKPNEKTVSTCLTTAKDTTLDDLSSDVKCLSASE
ncbi:unnamed protein product [Enterobius vermicularis]|uniref:G_PROTEIN_RECEP_F1_2 domain-containing protein n=1 Tax=Enterobius vermicularis TaxID=51028 RepID=A0A0N4VHF3_ENTVE|nr:unnamed protein product [Enterobius vermicularis]